VDIAMMGTRGVPAQYGGFETAVEEVGRRLVADGHRVVVYCRNPGQTQPDHLGMELVNLPALRKRSLETLSHTGLSVAHALRHRPDVAVLFNAGNAPYLPILKAARIPTAVHMDGLEWKRAKWRGFGARYYRWAERAAARSGLPLIADARGIADHLLDAYGADSHVIAYGAPILEPGSDRLAEVDVTPHGYHLVVARLEPENHVDVVVRGYADSGSPHPLVVVGAAPYGNVHVASIRVAAGASDVRFLGALWDQDLLNELYAGALSYLHGHSVGGTNPSLLRAMGCGAPVTAFDVGFNREVTAGHARFFRDAASVAAAINADDQDPAAAGERGRAGQRHAGAAYRWDQVAEAYLRLLSGMVSR
jgi:glycosyltransferase involved in cell wall biosynthesis